VGRRGRLIAGILVAVGLAAPTGAAGAGQPAIEAEWVTGVTSTSAVLHAEIDPDGLSSRYHFEYLTLAAYEANLAAARQPFAGATRAPPADAGVGNGTAPVEVSFALTAPVNPLLPGTAYRYRAVASNEAGPAVVGPVRFLRTRSPGPPAGLPDGRAWEMVSPVDKLGGSIAAPGALFGGGSIQAASGGEALTYGSATAFGEASGAPPASQYLSTRTASGWSTRNISTPLESGGYGDQPDGAPYRIFSEDLARALLLNPRRCDAAGPCPRSYALRETATGALTPLPPQAAGMRVLSASPDLARVRFESEGEAYEWSGAGLVAVSLLPPSAGAGAAFQASSADGRFSFYTEGGRLYRYDRESGAATDLTPSGGVIGVLGAAAAGDTVYFQDGAGLRRWHDGTTTTVAAGADATLPSDYPPATATVRLTGDGDVLAFLSAAPIGEFDNADADTGVPDAEVYLYDAGADSLLCASCNPTGERPAGSASIPGAEVNGSTTVYRPRVLSADGRRLFFDSEDALVAGDTDSKPDVYEWEAAGEGSCVEAPGCVSLISGGRGEGGRFLDASAEGTDAYFLTGDSLVGSDPGSIDAYDARVGGGFPEPEAAIPCNGDACQPLPSPPPDPTAGTSIESPANPAPRYAKERRHRRHRHRHHRHRHRHDRRSRDGRR